jgi:glucan biosynthesis protein C
MSLGVLLHAAASFVVTPIGWAIRDPAANIAADLSIGVIHLFRMPVFFLLSGFFARLVCLRLGIKGFLLHRFKRIVIPLVVTLPLMSVSLDALWLWGSQQGLAVPVSGWSFALPSFDMGAVMVSSFAHLWFLYYLAVLLLLVAGAVSLFRDRLSERLASRVGNQFRLAIEGRYLAFVMAIPTACVLWFMALPGLPDTPLSVVPQPRLLAYYGSFLAAGWLLHRQRDLMPALGLRLRSRLVIAALAAIPYSLWVVHEVVSPGTDPASRAVGLYFGALLTWELSLLFVGGFVRYLSSPPPWVRWVADASYWCYLVHLPVVVAIQILVAPLEWPGIVKYALIVGGALGVSLVTYQAFVRYTFVGATLNGKRGRIAPPQQVSAEA